MEASANRLSHNSLLPGYDYENRHSAKISNYLNHIRVLQKNGKHLVGEDFTPLADEIKKNYESKRDSSCGSASAYKTRTEMFKERKSKDVKLLQIANDNYES